MPPTTQGCVDSVQVTLLAKPLPALDAAYEATLFCEYAEVMLTGGNGARHIGVV